MEFGFGLPPRSWIGDFGFTVVVGELNTDAYSVWLRCLMAASWWMLFLARRPRPGLMHIASLAIRLATVSHIWLVLCMSYCQRVLEIGAVGRGDVLHYGDRWHRRRLYTARVGQQGGRVTWVFSWLGWFRASFGLELCQRSRH